MAPWMSAAGWGMIAGMGLLVGVAAAFVMRPSHRGIARVMTLGAGTLLGTVSIQLAVSAQRETSIALVIALFLAGALLVSSVNAWLERAGAQHRKRCGDCVAQDNERDRPGSGQAIAIGTIMDAVPEGLVLGIAAQETGPALAIVAGFFVANVPEALSGSAGMRRAGRSIGYVVSVWSAAALVTPVAAFLGALLLASASSEMTGALDAFSGGILLALAVETMIPEAFREAPRFSGTIAVFGFAIIPLLAVVA